MTKTEPCTVDCYSASNFNQLCQDFDRLNEKYLALKKACEEAEPVAFEWVDAENGMQVSFNEPPEYPEVFHLRPLFPHPAPVIASEQKPVAYMVKRSFPEGTGYFKDFVKAQHEAECFGGDAISLFTTPPNTADIEQRVAEAFVTKFKQHVGGDGYFWLHELEDFCEDGKWRE